MKKSVYVWPATKDNIDTIDLNFNIASPQIVDEAIKMYLKYLMDLNGKEEKDITRVTSDADVMLAKKAMEIMIGIEGKDITMEKYGPFVMEGEFKKAIPNAVFNYWLASGKVYAVSADLYRIRK